MPNFDPSLDDFFLFTQRKFSFSSFQLSTHKLSPAEYNITRTKKNKRGEITLRLADV